MQMDRGRRSVAEQHPEHVGDAAPLDVDHPKSVDEPDTDPRRSTSLGATGVLRGLASFFGYY